MKCTHECERPVTSSAIASLPSTDDELSEYLTQIAKDETCTPICHSFVGRIPCMTMFCTVVTLQVFFNVKTPGTQLYTMVKTGKGEHAQFNDYIPLYKTNLTG